MGAALLRCVTAALACGAGGVSCFGLYCPGVAGSVAESRESGGRLQSQFGGPEAKYFPDIAYGSERNYDKQLATIC